MDHARRAEEDLALGARHRGAADLVADHALPQLLPQLLYIDMSMYLYIYIYTYNVHNINKNNNWPG